MTFDEVLAQVLELLQREGRVSYRALKRRFGLDEAYLEDLKEEIIAAKQLAIDEGGRVLVWTGTPAPPPVREREPAPLAFTPSYLTEKILTSRTALEGERKQITVLFADIQGSTELIAGLDPEEARQILDPVLHLMMDAVHRYEGTVNQVLGDGIMALFGAPLAHEDHARLFCHWPDDAPGGPHGTARRPREHFVDRGDAAPGRGPGPGDGAGAGTGQRVGCPCGGLRADGCEPYPAAPAGHCCPRADALCGAAPRARHPVPGPGKSRRRAGAGRGCDR